MKPPGTVDLPRQLGLPVSAVRVTSPHLKPHTYMPPTYPAASLPPTIAGAGKVAASYRAACPLVPNHLIPFPRIVYPCRRNTIFPAFFVLAPRALRAINWKIFREAGSSRSVRHGDPGNPAWPTLRIIFWRVTAIPGLARK